MIESADINAQEFTTSCFFLSISFGSRLLSNDVRNEEGVHIPVQKTIAQEVGNAHLS